MSTAIPTGRVLNIQHFCTHDGPGIRTTVFLKGCPLRCKWCSNPESIHPKPELAYNPKKCIGEKQCGYCIKACPESAIFVVGSDGHGAGEAVADQIHVNWDLCTNCGKCVPTCPTEALYEFGHDMTVDEVLAEVEQDSSFYRESGGGITVSGGECLLQPDFTAAPAGGSTPAWNQHGNRNGGQRPVALHGEGASARGSGPARPQVYRPRAA